MSGSELAVLGLGIAAIAWVNWYFFAGDRGTTRAARSGGMQEVTVVVEGGYSPGTVHVRGGEPVRLVFDRRETSGCSEEVVIPDFGIRRFLAPHEKTVVEFSPEASGTHEFTCGMGMLKGRIVVEDGEG